MNDQNKVADPDIIGINLMLLEKLEQEEWDEFATLAQGYITAVEEMIVRLQQETATNKKEELWQLLSKLQANDAEIAHRLQARLQELNENMAQLQQNKKCCQHYAAQMPSRQD